ncbi:hypothetical protein [Nocardioides convexus]|uniref:hypothetical protein n=1 Tax=Nocardioides convexus TaxID=2712224 RepID=UPI002418284D|nr:hypothetical protein [Nocardioides convexus]
MLVLVVHAGRSEPRSKPPEPAFSGPVPTAVATDGRTQPTTLPKRPNVVLVMSDDMRTDDLAFAPNLRKVDRRARGDLRELLLAVPAVLPGPGVVPAGAVRPQPPRVVARPALRLRRLRRLAHHRHLDARRGLPHRLHRQVPQPLRAGPLQGDRRAVGPLRPQRLGRLACRGRAAGRLRHPRQHLRLHGHPVQRERPDRQPLPRRLPERRDRRLLRRDGEAVREAAEAVLHVRQLRRTPPRHAERPRRAGRGQGRERARA